MKYKNVSPNIHRLHSEDRKEIIHIVGKYQAKIKLSFQELFTLQRLTEHYIGGQYTYATTFRLARVWDYVLRIVDKVN